MKTRPKLQESGIQTHTTQIWEKKVLQVVAYFSFFFLGNITRILFYFFFCTQFRNLQYIVCGF